MWIETCVWLAFTIIIVIVGFWKSQFFNRIKYFAGADDLKDSLNAKKKDFSEMSLEDKMELIRLKDDMGEDLPSMVFCMLLFLVGFYSLMYFKIDNFIQGLCMVYGFALVFAIISAKIVFDKYKQYHFINTFINYIYGGTLLVYLKFIDTVHPLLLIVLSIIVFWGTGKLLSKLFK